MATKSKFLTGIDPNTYTLAQARAWIAERARDTGAECPCCFLNAKAYKYAFDGQLARMLYAYLEMDLLRPDSYMAHGALFIKHAKFIAPGSGGAGRTYYLPAWGLVEIREDGARRISEYGKQFIFNEEFAIDKYRYFYAGRQIEIAKPDKSQITFKQALGESFNAIEVFGRAF
jgi:hypothetical protein